VFSEASVVSHLKYSKRSQGCSKRAIAAAVGKERKKGRKKERKKEREKESEIRTDIDKIATKNRD
jgi:hypothetical protein